MEKRGKGYNSNTGQGAVMGLHTGKVIDFTTKTKSCSTCDMQQGIINSPKFMIAEKIMLDP